jgi:ADP-ribose pyrophosphatase YjhB (NUDIX family)
MNFQELSRSVHDAGPRMRIGEVSVRGPGGVVFRRSYLHTPDAVAVVAVHRGDLLLVREFRAAVGAPVLQVPTGKVGAGRDPAACAADELAEEAGMRAGRCEPAGRLLSCPGWMNQTVYVFRATDLTELPERAAGDPDDHEELASTVVRVPVGGFGGLVRDGTVCDARTIAAVQLALG